MSGDKRLQIPFDQYQRYKKTIEIINHFRLHDERFSILEIGANAHKNLEKFLPNDTIKYLDIELPAHLHNDPQYILGDATNMTFLKDSSFDIVIAMDVFEHIPKDLRENFLIEIDRVSARIFILAGPFDTEGVCEAEAEANQYYKNKYGEDYIWLYEHLLNQLPALDETLKFLENQNCKIAHFSHGSVELWKKLILCHFEVAKNISLQNIRQSIIDDFYNQYIFDYDISENNYRQFIIGSKSEFTSFSELFQHTCNEIETIKCGLFHKNIEALLSLSLKQNMMLFTQLYLDYGKGFPEANSIKLPIAAEHTNVQEFIFDLSDKPAITTLRLDPLSDSCVIEFESLQLIKNDGSVVDLVPNILSNAASYMDGKYFFDTIDSNCNFRSVDFADAQKLIVHIRYLHIGREALEVCVHQTKTDLEQTKTDLEQTKTAFDRTKTAFDRTKTELEQIIEDLRNELILIHNSKSWKYTKPIRYIVKKINSHG